MVSRRSVTSAALIVAVTAGTWFSGLAIGGAQDAATTDPSMPAYIVSGDCSNFDANPVGTLNNAELIGTPAEDDEEATREVVGTLTASPVLMSETEEVDVPFDDVLAASHSVTIHLSQDEVQTVVACGDIGGAVVDDELTIAMHEVDGSGFNGIATLSKNGDDQVNVTLYVAGPDAAEDEGTPAA